MARSNHIAIFSALFFPNVGGVEKYTDNLSRALVSQGYSVTIITNNTLDVAEREILDSGAEVVRLPCVSLLSGRMPLPRFCKRYRRLWREIEDDSYSGIFVNTRFYPHSLMGLKLAKRKGLRAIVCEHGSAYLTLGSRVLDRLLAVYERLMTAMVKKYSPDFYAVSGKSSEWLKTFGVETKGVLSNAIDADSFVISSSNRSFRMGLAFSGEDLLACYIGRFVPEKGIHELLGAMRSLEEESVPVKLVMAGYGPLESAICDAGLSNVFLVGKLSQGDIAALLLDADVLCLPTRSEGFSTSLLEAAACGTPAIVTDVGGACEVIPDSTYGTVIEDMESNTIARALRWAAGHRDLLAEQGARCRTRVCSMYTWDDTARAVVKAFEGD